jgi:hypothetical protein
MLETFAIVLVVMWLLSLVSGLLLVFGGRRS